MRNQPQRTTARTSRPYERETAGIPPVPDYDRAQAPGREGWTAGGAVVILCLLLAGTWFFVIRPVAGHPGAYTTPTLAPTHSPVTSTTRLTCPDARQLASNLSTPPSLDFCSPKYNGDVAGPVGSHIVLVGEHFASTTIRWALTKSQAPGQKQPGEDLMRNCFTQSNVCNSLSAPSTYQSQLGVTLFSWTWTPASGFPTDTSDYFVVALVGKLPGGQLVASSVSFTLLTSQPPCIVITHDQHQAPTCSASAPTLHLTQGETITIVGANWLLGWTKAQPSISETIDITATCAPSGQCNVQKLFHVTAQANAQGAFTTSLNLPPNATGTYEVTATSSAPQIATPDADPNSNGNTIVDGALTFGEPGDMGSLLLVVS